MIRKSPQFSQVLLIVTALAWVTFGGRSAVAASAAEIDRRVNAALADLYETTPAAKSLAEVAKGILVFPRVTKGGFFLGGQYGEGALLRDGVTAGYYNTAGVSYGLQIGAQTYGYALFFMTESALAYLDESEGWEVGTGPSLVVLDEGMAKNLTSTTLRDDVYAFVFGQQGLMAGVALQGAKITKIHPPY